MATIIGEPTEPKMSTSAHSRITKLKRLIRRFVDAEVELSWAGNREQNEHLPIEEERRKAKQTLLDYLKELESELTIASEQLNPDDCTAHYPCPNCFCYHRHLSKNSIICNNCGFVEPIDLAVRQQIEPPAQ